MEEGSLTKILIGLLFGFGVMALARLLRSRSPEDDKQKKDASGKDKNQDIKS